MDRRKRKTRQAIFNAFTKLLSKKSYNKITVEEILELADVGRATFYAHFETKEHLLRNLCLDLFEHVLEAQAGDEKAHAHIFDCAEQGSPFLHLLRHLQTNDNNILKLLSGENAELFLVYFKNSVKTLIRETPREFITKKPAVVPEDFWVNHVASTFVETALWWIENGKNLSPETVYEYFLSVI